MLVYNKWSNMVLPHDVIEVVFGKGQHGARLVLHGDTQEVETNLEPNSASKYGKSCC